MHGAMTSRVLLLLSLVFAAPVSVFADIYKWVDENGQVHFTDSPPPNEGERVEVDVQAPPAEPDEGELRRLELIRQSELRRAHNESLAEKDEQEVHAPARRVAACEQARVSWYALNQRMPVYWTEDGTLRPHWSNDTYRGERRYVADADRETTREEIEARISRNCPNGHVENAAGTAYQRWLADEWCAVYRVRLEAAQQDGARTPDDKIEDMEAQVQEACAS
ncbi:MAG: DUF4124 domain-containing protein [Pseudomonadota bacterium]